MDQSSLLRPVNEDVNANAHAHSLFDSNIHNHPNPRKAASSSAYKSTYDLYASKPGSRRRSNSPKYGSTLSQQPNISIKDTKVAAEQLVDNLNNKHNLFYLEAVWNAHYLKNTEFRRQVTFNLLNEYLRRCNYARVYLLVENIMKYCGDDDLLYFVATVFKDYTQGNYTRGNLCLTNLVHLKATKYTYLASCVEGCLNECSGISTIPSKTENQQPSNLTYLADINERLAGFKKYSSNINASGFGRFNSTNVNRVFTGAWHPLLNPLRLGGGRVMDGIVADKKMDAGIDHSFGDLSIFRSMFGWIFYSFRLIQDSYLIVKHRIEDGDWSYYYRREHAWWNNLIWMLVGITTCFILGTTVGAGVGAFIDAALLLTAVLYVFDVFNDGFIRGWSKVRRINYIIRTLQAMNKEYNDDIIDELIADLERYKAQVKKEEWIKFSITLVLCVSKILFYPAAVIPAKHASYLAFQWAWRISAWMMVAATGVGILYARLGISKSESQVKFKFRIFWKTWTYYTYRKQEEERLEQFIEERRKSEEKAQRTQQRIKKGEQDLNTKLMNQNRRERRWSDGGQIGYESMYADRDKWYG